jgi:DNA-binding transcriptional ArsR family regulator
VNIGQLPNIDSGGGHRTLIEQLFKTLRDLRVVINAPRWGSLVPGQRNRIDAEVDLIIAGTEVTLFIEAKSAAYPRDVHQYLSQLRFANRHSPQSSDTNRIPLIVANSISQGAKQLLRDEHVGYYDSGGSLYLPAQGAYIDIDKPPPKTLSKSIKSLFSGRRTQVLQTLLLHPSQWFGGTQLADAAMVSPATVSEVLSELERFDWVESRGQGPSKQRRLKEPATLLDFWVQQLVALPLPKLHRFYVPALNGEDLLQSLARGFAKREVPYAVSYETAAQAYAPYLSEVSQVRCRLIRGPDVAAALADLGARPVNDGMNLAIIDAKTTCELIYRQHINGAWIANPIQVYLDLLRGNGRAKEMAEHLRQAKLQF